MGNDEKKQLLLELISPRSQYFYSNFAHNNCSFSTYLNGNFVPLKDIRELPLKDMLNCYLKIGSTEFYIFKFLNQTLLTLEKNYNLIKTTNNDLKK